MAKRTVKAAPKLAPIPYAGQWDPDESGRPIGLIASLITMVFGWLERKPHDTPRIMTGLPGPTVLHDELQRLGVATTLQYPRTCLDVLPGDICLVDYGQFPRELVQDVSFYGWHWVIYLGFDETSVYVNDPNWSGDRRNEGNALGIPLDSWELAFHAHTRGLSCVRLNVPGPSESVVDYHAPLTDKDREVLDRMAKIYGADDQPTDYDPINQDELK